MGDQIPATVTRERDAVADGLTVGAAVLTLATAYIHSTLGGLLFTLNAVGYTVLAVGLIAPIGLLRRFRWLVRLGLLGFVAATIGGWMLIGARIEIAYLDKAIEVVLVAVLVAGIVRSDGGARGVITRLRALPAEVSGLVRGTT